MATDFLEVANNAAGVLDTTIDDDDTSVVLGSGQGALFPSAYPYDITIDSEILRVTNKSTDTLTVTRAQQGTAADDHTSGATVELRVTAGIVSQIQSSLGTLEDAAVLLAGRSGGQTITGGTGSGEVLTLKSTSNTSAAAEGKFDLTGHQGNSFNFALATTLTTSQTAITVGTGTTAVNTGGGMKALTVGGTWNLTGDPAGTPFLVFNFGAQINITTSSATDLNSPEIYASKPTLTLKTAAGADVAYLNLGVTPLPFSHFLCRSVFNRDTPVGSGSTGTITIMTPFLLNDGYGAGWTLTTFRGFHISPTGVSGGFATITNYIGIDIEDPSIFTLTNPAISLRSIGAATQMRHAGPAVFGANAAPTAGSVALEVQSTTTAFLPSRMTTTERDAMTEVVGMVVWNSTASKLQVCTATGSPGTWADLH